MLSQLNGDGKIDAWEKEVYDRLMKADSDNDGHISRVELFKVMASLSREVTEAKVGGISITALNPDTDGDGKVEEWETEVYNRIVAADTDNTGFISVRNLFDFIRQMSNEVKEAAKGGIPIVSLNPDTDGGTPIHPWGV